jgi:2-polyprenyl-3-methyl-5-hydroxy-6-metoxy-1,4-benzoquinol methylase
LNSLLSVHPSIGPKNIGMDLGSDQSIVDALLKEASFNRIAHNVERKSLWDEFFPIPAYVGLRTGAELTIFQSGLDDGQTESLKVKLADGLSEPRLLAKLPSNTFRIHVLRELFPDAKIIAIHRDGRDVVASWGSKDGHSWEMLGGYEQAIATFSRKWNESIDHIETFKSEIDIHVVHYEGLITNTVEELEKLLSFCELEPYPNSYNDMRLQSRHRQWISTIPPEHHAQVNRLTYRNRLRLGYLDSEFDASHVAPDSADDKKGFAEYYRSSEKIMHVCPICRSGNFRQMTDKDRHDIGLITSICTSCGLVQCNPRCGDLWYEEFYSKSFWRLYIGNDNVSLEKLYVEDEQDYKGKQIGSLLMERTNNLENVRDYLDIGCGLGGLASYMTHVEPVLNVSVVEPSGEAVDFLRSRHPEIHINQYSIENLESMEDSSFDLISMVHVLEHVQDPLKTMLEVRRLLRDDGVAYIEVPEFMNRNWRSKNYLHIAHKYIFDRDTLARLVCEAGLKVRAEFSSPVERLWPWAFGVIVSRSDDITTLKQQDIAGTEIDRRVELMQKKLKPKGFLRF